MPTEVNIWKSRKPEDFSLGAVIAQIQGGKQGIKIRAERLAARALEADNELETTMASQNLNELAQEIQVWSEVERDLRTALHWAAAQSGRAEFNGADYGLAVARVRNQLLEAIMTQRTLTGRDRMNDVRGQIVHLLGGLR